MLFFFINAQNVVSLFLSNVSVLITVQVTESLWTELLAELFLYYLPGHDEASAQTL